MAAEQRPVVDDLGNIAVHGRSGLVLVVKIETATAGVYENISASDLFFEIGGKLRLALSAGADIYSRQVILTRAQIATLSINQPYAFAIHDETPSTPSTPWTGTITTFGFKAAPTGVPDVDGEAANWTGATVVIQPGGGSPVVVVNYMGQPGAAGAAGVGIPTGGTTGQYLRKSSSTDYATGWDTLTADDVSGLSSTLSTLTSADVSLTTRLSTEETTRASADTSLTTRLSTEEVTRSSAVSTVTVATTSLTTRVSTEEATRSSADTSLATAAAATYLPLAGGVMTGALAAVAGTAALPGLAVAGDLNTGMWSPAADTLAWSTAGTEKMRLTTGGLLGLGITPTSFLHVAGATGATLNTIYEPTGWAGLKHRVGVQYAGDTMVSSVNVRLTSLTAGTLDDATQPGSALVLRSDGVLTLVDTTAGSGVRTFAPMFGVSGTGVTTLYNNLLRSADNTYDDGALGANRVRRYYAGTQFVGPDGSNSSPAFTFAGDTATGIYRDAGGGRIRIAVGGAYALNIGQSVLALVSDTAAIHLGSAADTLIAREAANTLALRNGVNAQTFRVYNTYTDGSNYERLSLSYSGGDFRIASEQAGTGSARSLMFATGNTNRWFISGASGSLFPNSDATYDLGSPSQQIRDLHLSRRLLVGGTAPAGASGLATIQAFGSAYAFIGGDSVTDATTKNTRVGALHYLAAEKPVAMMLVGAASATNSLSIGGGTSSANAATQINFYTATNNVTPTGSLRWAIDTNGHFVAAADNTYDFGASGANRPRAIYAATEINCAAVVTAGVASDFRYQGSTRIRNVSDGVITLLNNAANNFSRVQYGGTTSSFPAQKRSGTTLQAVLADDSGWGFYQGKLQTHANAVAETPTATHTLTLYDAAGTAYKVLAVAA